MKAKKPELASVDVELAPTLRQYMDAMRDSPGLNDIPAVRLMMARILATRSPDISTIDSLEWADRRIRNCDDSDVGLRIYRPKSARLPLPALLWIHGGGYCMGTVDDDDLRIAVLLQQVPCVIVSVDYRLAPENPYPAGLDDCACALGWLLANASEMGVDSSRVVVGGASAGGGLAAALALYARDKMDVKLAGQLLIYPMLDDRNVTQANDETVDTILWTRENNLLAWRAYLDKEPGGESTAIYASPSRADSLAGLPPAYIGVGDLDLFLEENIEFASRLLSDGVLAELHVYEGAFHGFDELVKQAQISQRFTSDWTCALRRWFSS